jgi:hypothetical protein
MSIPTSTTGGLSTGENMLLNCSANSCDEEIVGCSHKRRLARAMWSKCSNVPAEKLCHAEQLRFGPPLVLPLSTVLNDDDDIDDGDDDDDAAADAAAADDDDNDDDDDDDDDDAEGASVPSVILIQLMT